MMKSKTEQYMEKLQKWKEQKMKEKEERLKNKIRPYDAKSGTKTVVTKAAVKPVVVPSRSVTSQNVGRKISTGLPVKKTSVGRLSTAKPTSKVNAAKEESKKEKKTRSAETRELVERLTKWKEERKSEKKQIQHSGLKLKPGPMETEKTHKKVVKSRLFDYQVKQKSEIKQKDKENVFVGLNGRKDKETKFGASTRKQSSSKSDFKRRHSEVQKSETQTKPIGILKRKSCIGSFDFTGEENNMSAAKGRCHSMSTTEEVEKQNVCSTKREGDIEEGSLEVETAKAQIPTAVVTPGVSTRNVRFISPPQHTTHSQTLRKTPKTPTTRRTELSDWLKAKGRTPSKFRHLMCFHGEHSHDLAKDPHTKNTLSVDELTEQMDVIEQERLQSEAEDEMNAMLDECTILFEAGCPMKSILPWLDDIYTKIPCAQSSARFYICKANVVKYSHDLDAVLQIFEQATINDAKPREDIAKCLTETLKYVTEEKVKEAKRRCRTPRRDVQEENVFESSAVVYTVSAVTPLSERKRSSSKMAGNGQCQVVTPVRRSTRRSLQNLPESLKDKKKSFSSLDEVPGDNILFQCNTALDNVFDSEDKST